MFKKTYSEATLSDKLFLRKKKKKNRSPVVLKCFSTKDSLRALVDEQFSTTIVRQRQAGTFSFIWQYYGVLTWE